MCISIFFLSSPRFVAGVVTMMHNGTVNNFVRRAIFVNSLITIQIIHLLIRIVIMAEFLTLLNVKTVVTQQIRQMSALSLSLVI